MRDTLLRNGRAWLVIAAVLATAAWFRFIDLGRASVKTDEINFLVTASQGMTLIERWTIPFAGLNQMPLGESIPIVWHWFRQGPPSETSVREPFALLGLLTVAGMTVWLYRRRGLAAAVLVGTWGALHPFHLYHSREAYYYCGAMALSAGMTLHTAALLARLRGGQQLAARDYAAWAVWTAVTCLTHMGTWVVAAICWVLLMSTAIAPAPWHQRKRHATAMLAAASAITIFMLRWIWSAFGAIAEANRQGGHIGNDFSWVASRLIPFFTIGANSIGVATSLLLLGGGIYAVVMNRKKSKADRDLLYEAITTILVAGLLGLYVYVGVVGHGKGKVVYFSAMLPVFLVWAAYTCDIIAASLPGRWPTVMRIALPCLLVGILAQPAWMVTRLDGKPTPYRKIRDWLDEHLDPGSVAIIDRWYEPWNELKLYAPKKVAVTFPVPDEPYELYRQLQWRDVAQRMIEQGKAQAFIRLTRNHESRDGVWTWPETHLARRGMIVNEVALWLRDRGYIADQDFFVENRNRVVTEIFYDRREDTVKRLQAAGDRFAVFFDETMRYEKSGPMEIFRLQSQQFIDWRVLDQAGLLDVYNLGNEPRRGRLRVRAVSPSGPKSVVGAGTQRFEFGGGQLQEWVMDAANYQPGPNTVSFTDPKWEADQRPLFIESVDVLPDTDAAPR